MKLLFDTRTWVNPERVDGLNEVIFGESYDFRPVSIPITMAD